MIGFPSNVNAMNNLNKSYNINDFISPSTFDFLADTAAIPGGLVNRLAQTALSPTRAIAGAISGLAQGESLPNIAGRTMYHLNPLESGLYYSGDIRDKEGAGWVAGDYADNFEDNFYKWWSPKTREDAISFGDLMYSAIFDEKPVTSGKVKDDEFRASNYWTNVDAEKTKEEDRLAKIQAAQDKLEQEQNRRYERQRAALKDASVAMLNWGKSDKEPFRFNLLGV